MSALVFDHVSKSYGAIRALDQLSLDLQPGETVALLGPNGAGKSTSISLILGLIAPDQGDIHVLSQTPERALRSGQVGAMLQSGAGNGLPKFATIRETIELFRACYPRSRAVDEVLEVTGLADIADQRVERLSGGQAQRVHFALAICGAPKLVFLDEPTVGMDVESRRHFWQVMREAAADGMTVVFATHYLEEADAIADRIVVLHHGQLVADGTSSEIKARTSSRIVRFSVTKVEHLPIWTDLAGVDAVSIRGRDITLTCSDADQAVRALVNTEVGFHSLAVTGVGLEEAFLDLTGDH